MTIDERPHIKYDWTIGKRLKFSCTVYYAKQFDALRRRCGVEDVFVRSMAKCEPWKAQGGKSRSNFWKTSDDRFIIKTLVNAWNVADLYVALFSFPCWVMVSLLNLNNTTSRTKIKPSSHRPCTVLFPSYGFNGEPSVDTREIARLLYRRSSQLGNRDRTSKGGSSRDGKFVLQPKAYENVRP